MPIRYGMNFPAWFNPDYPPVPPEKPLKPEPFTIEKKDILVKEIYFHGLTVAALIEMISPFNYSEYVILTNDEFIGIYQVVETKIPIEEKDYAKKIKDYERNLRQYSTFYSEYQTRLNKYDDLLMRYRDNEYRTRIDELQDFLMEKRLEFSIAENEVFKINKEIEELSQKLKVLNGE